jgi:hypothetical protein
MIHTRRFPVMFGFRVEFSFDFGKIRAGQLNLDGFQCGKSSSLLGIDRNAAEIQ